MTALVERMFADPSTIEATAAKLAEQAAVLDGEIDELNATLKEKKSQTEKVKEQICDLLIQGGVESLKLTNGLTPRVAVEQKFYKCKDVDDEALHRWLHTTGLHAIIIPYVHHSRLNATLKQHVERGGEIDPAVIQTSERRTVMLFGKSKFLAQRATAGPAGDRNRAAMNT
jgi:hypothetical protein